MKRPSEQPEDFLPDDSHFYCGVEWHLQRMASKFAAILHPFARRVSGKRRIFSAAAENTAAHFRVNRKTVDSAAEEIARVGFFELLETERFKPNVYRVVDHKEWAERNPGQCVQKVSYPWDGEGDPLGQQLYAVSGQRVTFFRRQITGLRNVGFSDDAIIEEFRAFLDESDYKGKRWKRVYYDFHAHLKVLTASRS